MIKKLRDILNTYTEEELEDMDLWVNAENKVTNIYIDDYSIVLITTDAEVKINDVVEKEHDEK